MKNKKKKVRVYREPEHRIIGEHQDVIDFTENTVNIQSGKGVSSIFYRENVDIVEVDSE